MVSCEGGVCEGGGFASIQGTMEVVKQSDGNIIFDIQPGNRAVFLKNDDISSIPSKDIKKICNELKKMIGSTLRMSFKDNNQQKFAKLDKVRTFTRNGKDNLRITASSRDFDAIGSFARNAIQIAETPKTCEEATIDFIVDLPKAS